MPATSPTLSGFYGLEAEAGVEDAATNESLVVEIEGLRPDLVPSPFTSMKLVFIARGNVDDHKLQRAVSLAVEKYCSARATLGTGVPVTWEARVEPPNPASQH